MPSSSQMERKFNAAVNVIRGLPKNGSYQPSNDMMLRFYSFYKQATQGPCTQSKPAFWDVVGRAKYDSYNALGTMPKERAMELYVDELKKIIETMSYTESVAKFMGSISDANGIEADDLEAVTPVRATRAARSNSDSSLESRDSSPVQVTNGNGYTNGLSNRQEYFTVNGNSHIEDIIQNGHSSDQHSDDEYIDTVEDDIYLLREPIVPNRASRTSTRRPTAGNDQQIREITTTTTANASPNYTPIEPAIQQILRTIECMRTDLQRINGRIDIVERSMTDVKNHQLRKKLALASKNVGQHGSKKCGCETVSRCPPCNPIAGCRIWGCPCVHDGFTMHPGNEPLNAPRPAGCPKCPCSVCDNLAIKCVFPYLSCDAEQVATYKCIEPIENAIPCCPPCNPTAGCRIWRCPCVHDGFTMHPGNEPLNAPRPDGCPKCPCSVCDNLAIKCATPYRTCDAEQVDTYKCIEPIQNTGEGTVDSKLPFDFSAVQS